MNFAQLEKLPATPDALKARIADIVKRGNVRTSAGRLSAEDQRQAVFSGLVSLVSALPATPKVRAAAFRAIATYPNVKNLGAVSGGQALEITSDHPAPPPRPAAGGGRTRRDRDRLVVDPATGRVHETNFFVTPDGAEAFVPGGATIVAEWTKSLPH